MKNQTVAVFVDEANVRNSAKGFGRKLDWLALREYLASEDEGRRLTEFIVYYGMAPHMDDFRDVREGQERFVHWLRTQGFYVVTKDGSPAGKREDGRPNFKANVDVLMAIDGLDYAMEMRPDIVVLVTGDSDFAQFALKLRRRGMRVEVAAVAQSLSSQLKAAANGVIDLAEVFNGFEALNGHAAPIGTDTVFDS